MRVATWKDVGEELPSEVRLALAPAAPDESKAPATASLFDSTSQSADLQPHERKLFSRIKADQSVHIDELVEKLEQHLSSSEIFSALFELEMCGGIKQLPGKNYVRSFRVR